MKPLINHLRRAFGPAVRYVWWPLFIVLIATGSNADTCSERTKGQTVYVPVYSHIYSGDQERPIYLAVTLSLRNTDTSQAITITRVDYYDSNGQLIKNYVEAPVSLKAMASTRYVIKESDKVGGSGANFIVDWKADQAVTPPLIETVMISARQTLGISFTSRGQVIEPAGP